MTKTPDRDKQTKKQKQSINQSIFIVSQKNSRLFFLTPPCSGGSTPCFAWR